MNINQKLEDQNEEFIPNTKIEYKKMSNMGDEDPRRIDIGFENNSNIPCFVIGLLLVLNIACIINTAIDLILWARGL